MQVDVISINIHKLAVVFWIVLYFLYKITECLLNLGTNKKDGCLIDGATIHFFRERKYFSQLTIFKIKIDNTLHFAGLIEGFGKVTIILSSVQNQKLVMHDI